MRCKVITRCGMKHNNKAKTISSSPHCWKAKMCVRTIFRSWELYKNLSGNDDNVCTGSNNFEHFDLPHPYICWAIKRFFFKISLVSDHEIHEWLPFPLQSHIHPLLIIIEPITSPTAFHIMRTIPNQFLKYQKNYFARWYLKIIMKALKVQKLQSSESSEYSRYNFIIYFSIIIAINFKGRLSAICTQRRGSRKVKKNQTKIDLPTFM